MPNQPTSFRFPFKIEAEHPQIEAAIRYAFSGLKDVNDAIVSLNGKVGSVTPSVTNVTENVTSSSGGGGTFPVFGNVNLQPNLTPGAYSLTQRDLGGLILVNSSIAFALTLNSGLMTPFFTTVYGFGSGTITATPSAQSVNNVASIKIFPNQFAIIYFDGMNWWALLTPTTSTLPNFSDGEAPTPAPNGATTAFSLLHSPVATPIVEQDDLLAVLGAGSLGFSLVGNALTMTDAPIRSLHVWYRY